MTSKWPEKSNKQLIIIVKMYNERLLPPAGKRFGSGWRHDNETSEFTELFTIALPYFLVKNIFSHYTNLAAAWTDKQVPQFVGYDSQMKMSRYNTNDNVPISRIYCIGELAYQKGNIINERRKAREYRARKKLQATTWNQISDHTPKTELYFNISCSR